MAKLLRREPLMITLAILCVISSSVSALKCPSQSEVPYCIQSLTPNTRNTECDLSCTLPHDAEENQASFSINVQQSRQVLIQCITKDMDYHKIPNMEVGTVESVVFTVCPLPSDMPLLSIIRKMGITSFKNLRFTTYKLHLLDTLTKNHLSGLHELERLYLNDCGLTELPSDLFEDLSNLTLLDLRSNKLKLPQGIFDPLVNLRFLELGSNNITNFEPKIFKKLRNLKTLNVWKNNLKSMQKDLFEGLDQLENLDLNSNGIVTLNRDVFSTLPNLSLIYLFSNEFSSLPSDLFVHNRNLSILKFSDNRRPLDVIPDFIFANLDKLDKINLDRCNIKEISGSAFINSSMITEIKLNNNALKSLPSDLFKTQVALRNLNLSKNLLNKLPDNLFSALKNLTVLDLSFNQIENITKDYFNGLSSLINLDMKNNQLKIIDNNAFSNVKQPALKSISMDNNFLTFAAETTTVDGEIAYESDIEFGPSSPFQDLLSLEKLYLRNNSLTETFKDWRLSMPALTFLDISYNKIRMISFDDIHFLGSYIDVHLNNNNISVIDFSNAEVIAKQVKVPDAYSMKATGSKQPVGVTIRLGNNPLKCDCSVYHLAMYFEGELAPEVRSVVELIDGGDLLCSSPEDLKNTPITKVDYRLLVCPLDNPNTKEKLCPEKCKCKVRKHDMTLIIDCSYANLTAVPQMQILTKINTNTINFTELYIQGNRIVQLPTTDMLEYSKVRVLNASFNNITALNMGNIPKNIEVLELANNNLTFINDSVLHYLENNSSLWRLTLGFNPWKCGCETVNLQLFVQKKFRSIADSKYITCFGKQLSDMKSDKLCPTKNVIIAASITIALLGLLVGILAAIFFKYQQEIKIWMFAHKICLWYVTEDELDKDKIYDAFISYSHRDEEFVTKTLVPELESGPTPFNLCLHYRNWHAGEYIQTQIVRSVEESKRTIIILSENFLKSDWGVMEFRAAHTSALKEGRARVIVIILGEIGPIDNLDPELKTYLSTNTYVKSDDPWFWKKLRYALPHLPTDNKRANLNMVEKVEIIGTDKVELVGIDRLMEPLTTPPADSVTKNPLLPKSNGMVPNGKVTNGLNGVVNGGFNGIKINENSKQSDV